MYAMPFPWFMPGSSSTHNDMGPKDWIEFIKAWDEYQKSNKPKDDKKPDKKPEDGLTTMEYFVIIWFITAVTIPAGTCLVLSYLTEFIKATH